MPYAVNWNSERNEKKEKKNKRQTNRVTEGKMKMIGKIKQYPRVNQDVHRYNYTN